MDVIARDVLVIGITSNKQQETAKKTREYLRRLSHKLPIGNLKAAESYRHLIVIELVCRSLRIQFDRQKLLSLVTNNSNHKNNNANDSNSNSNSSKKNSRNPLLTDYQKNYNMCKNLLQINYDKVSAMDYLCIAYGHELRKKAEEILETFRRVYVEKELSEYDKNSINLELPIFQSAAFYIAAKLEKVSSAERDYYFSTYYN